MRLGFTTSIFAKPLAAGEVNLGGLVDFAEEQGFRAVELRDEEASYSLGEVGDFVKDAGAKEMEVTYAVRNDMLQSGDEALIVRALERAALCGEGAIMRMLGSMSALAAADRKGYTRDEVVRIAGIAVRYSALAEEKGVILAMEHTREPLFGDAETYFGLADVLDEVGKHEEQVAAFGITFDPANAVFTALCKAPTSEEKVFEFLEAYNEYVGLVHYKTTRGGAPTSVIADADIDNEALFARLAKVYDGIVCLEIPGAADLHECRRNIDASLDYIRKNGLMGYFA